MEKPNTLAEDTPVNNMTTDVDGESYFFSYFMVICILFIMGYVFYHNRAKVSFYFRTSDMLQKTIGIYTLVHMLINYRMKNKLQDNNNQKLSL